MPHLFGPLGKTSIGGNLPFCRAIYEQDNHDEYKLKGSCTAFTNHKSDSILVFVFLCRQVARDQTLSKGVGVQKPLTGNLQNRSS